MNRLEFRSLRAYALFLAVLAPGLTHAQTISPSTYPLTVATGATLEDMSAGTKGICGPAVDDQTSPLQPIGFPFRFNGVEYVTFSANPNGMIRLGEVIAGNGSNNTNAFAGAESARIFPLFDNLNTGQTGRVHYRVATSPRRLIIEWRNVRVPRVFTAPIPEADNARFQAVLFEDGRIRFNYGDSLLANSSNGGASIGLHGGAGIFASINMVSGSPASPIVTYTSATPFDANTIAIPSGLQYTFTPSTPLDPTSTLLVAPGPNPGREVTLSWTNAPDPARVGTAIYRSDDGLSFDFWDVVGPTASTYTVSGLGNGHTYTFRVAAFSEGATSPGITAAATTTTDTASPVALASIAVPGDYATLQDVFSAIDAQGLAVPTVITLGASQSLAAPLQPPRNASPTRTITVRPGVPGIVIESTGATLATYPAINFDGARHVAIDGRVGSGSTRDLTIRNPASVSLGTGLINFVNDATGSAIRFVDVRGNNALAATSGGGLVTIGGIGPTNRRGNNAIAIEDCDIAPATDGQMAFGVTSIPSAPATAFSTMNRGVRIANNSIRDYFVPGTTFNGGIYIGGGNSGWQVTGNRFFQTSFRDYGAATALTASIPITLNNGTAPAAGGTGFIFSGNRIGFGDEGGSAGTFTELRSTGTGSGSVNFQGFSLAAAGSVSVTGNTISNVRVEGGGSAINGGVLLGILVAGNAEAQVANNVLGSIAPGATDLLRNVVSANTAQVTNIVQVQCPLATIEGNTIGAVAAVGASAATGSQVRGITTTGAGFVTVRNNTVGGSDPGSLRSATGGASTGTGATIVHGIRHFAGLASGGSLTIEGNSVRNLQATGTGGGSSAQAVGVLVGEAIPSVSSNTVSGIASRSEFTGVGSAASAVGIALSFAVQNGATIEGNRVSGVVADPANGTAAVSAVGIFHRSTAIATPPLGNVISRNLIHGIEARTTGFGNVTGLSLGNAGTATHSCNAIVVNNAIRVGLDASGASLTGGSVAYQGVLHDSNDGAISVWYNSILVGGGPVTPGAGASAAFRRVRTPATPGNVTVLAGNSLVNLRSGVGSGPHALLSLNDAAQVTSSANGLWSGAMPGPGAEFARIGAASFPDQAALNAAFPALDPASTSPNVDPQFSAPLGAVPDLSLLCLSPIAGRGPVIAGVTADLTGTLRPIPAATNPDIGAYEVSQTLLPAEATSPVLNPGPGTIHVAWTAPTGGADGFLVLRRAATLPTESPLDGTAPTVGSLIGVSDVVFVGAALAFTDTPPLPSPATYGYAVFAFNGSGGCTRYSVTPASAIGSTSSVASWQAH